MDFSKLSEWLKLSPKYLLPISIVTGFVIFAPIDILGYFGLVTLTNQYRPVVGIVFLLSTSLLIVDVLIRFYQRFQSKIQLSKALKTQRKRLHVLTGPEKKILSGFIGGKTRSQYLSVESGVVNGLMHEGIIYMSSNLGRYNQVAFNIQPWAWDYLNEHPELLKIKSETDRSSHK